MSALFTASGPQTPYRGFAIGPHCGGLPSPDPLGNGPQMKITGAANEAESTENGKVCIGVVDFELGLEPNPRWVFVRVMWRI